MTKSLRKEQASIESLYQAILIDATVEKSDMPNVGAQRVCWNTGEEKNCPSCYLSKGCKAKA